MGEICPTIFWRLLPSLVGRIHPLPDHLRRSDQVCRTLQGRQLVLGHRLGRRGHHHQLVLVLPGAQVLPDCPVVQEHVATVRDLHPGRAEGEREGGGVDAR